MRLPVTVIFCKPYQGSITKYALGPVCSGPATTTECLPPFDQLTTAMAGCFFVVVSSMVARFDFVAVIGGSTFLSASGKSHVPPPDGPQSCTFEPCTTPP